MDDRKRRLQDETRAARETVLALVADLDDRQFSRPTANEGWSVKDTLAHLASIETRGRLMLQTVLDGGAWAADRAELDAYNARCVAERRSWTPAAVVAELRETGHETAALLERLPSDMLDREWQHPIFGPMTIERTAGITARHLRTHIEDLRAALQD